MAGVKSALCSAGAVFSARALRTRRRAWDFRACRLKCRAIFSAETRGGSPNFSRRQTRFLRRFFCTDFRSRRFSFRARADELRLWRRGFWRRRSQLTRRARVLRRFCAAECRRSTRRKLRCSWALRRQSWGFCCTLKTAARNAGRRGRRRGFFRCLWQTPTGQSDRSRRRSIRTFCFGLTTRRLSRA